jgi:hypothetical protein
MAGYFDLGPIDFGENARRDIVLTLEDMGFEIETSHHEGAPAQHEVDFHYDEALKTADNIQTFRLAVRTIARQHGLHATFMPKPRAGVDGSGMHLNFSLHDMYGKNIFANPDNPEEQSQQTTESESIEGGENSLLNRISAINEVRYLHLRGCTLIIDGNTLQEQGLKESLKDNPVFESAEIRERREQPNGNLTGFDMIIKLREPIRK